MARSERHIVLDDATYEELYTLKGPRRTMRDVVRELLNKVYPQEPDHQDQTTLLKCPSCGEFSIDQDKRGYFCKSCRYEPEPQEIENV